MSTSNRDLSRYETRYVELYPSQVKKAVQAILNPDYIGMRYVDELLLRVDGKYVVVLEPDFAQIQDAPQLPPLEERLHAALAAAGFDDTDAANAAAAVLPLIGDSHG